VRAGAETLGKHMSDPKPPIENVPQCLCDRPQWVCWRYVERDGRRTKVPIDAHTGRSASATDRATWATFEVAHEAYLRSDNLAGIGFVFTKDDPFAGVDLDRCLDEQGEFIWGKDVVDEFSTYGEVSPSGKGVKLFLQGTKPAFARCRRDGFGPNGDGEIEIYDQDRFFVVTGRRLVQCEMDVARRQTELDALCARLWSQPSPPLISSVPSPDRQAESLRAMLAMKVIDHNDGSHRLYSACCRAVEHKLSDAEAIACIRAYERVQPFPASWSDADILKRLRDAERQCLRGQLNEVGITTPACKSVGQLLTDHPELRRPIIHNLLRQGETANLIAPSKVGKSWLVTDLALSLATGTPWLDTFPTQRGNVLLIDNELHAETSANRIPKVAKARGIPLADIANTVFVDNLRGRLKDIHALAPYFQQLQPGFFKLVVLDALYRLMPADSDENSNGTMASIYNQIDCYAGMLGCAFVLVHHVSKGNQAGKSVTDVGAGAGSQSRATDTHLILRPHELDDVVVLDAAVRSWPPIEPVCLRWTFPVWMPDPSLDPTALKPERPRRRPKAEAAVAKPAEPQWDAERFADEFVSETPATILAVIQSATGAGLSERKANKLLKLAEAQGLIHRWRFGATQPVQLATTPQPEVVA
jgi:hypothetical protein